MRLALALPALAFAGLAAAEEPRTVALLAAMGSRFSVHHEEQQTGSHIPPYRNREVEVAGDILNRFVLSGLDKAVARVLPESRRVHLSARQAKVRGIEPIVGHLSAMDRSGWDRIVVATPAFRAKGEDGLPTRLQGIGVFWQLLCESNVRWCGSGFRPPEGPKARTPEGEEIFANTYVAPFTYIDVWVLDATTLAVLDRTTSLGHRKLASPAGTAMGIVAADEGFITRELTAQIDAAVLEAVELSGLRGSVEVRERGPVR